MTNEEKYGVSKGMGVFMVYAKAHGIELSMQSFADWMEQETKEENQMLCPFCETKVDTIELTDGYICACDNLDCCYRSAIKNTKAEAIAAHNRVCKAVVAYNGSEVK